MRPTIHWVAVPALAVAASAPAYAVEYLTIEQARRVCWPAATGASFAVADVKLSKDQIKAIEKASGVRVRRAEQKLWRVTVGGEFKGWFIVDEVLGKHEFITWCLALNADGSVKQIEVMDYRETYGHEIRNEKWRGQFAGKKHGAKLKLDDDIKNISGATLSCRHITDGVKRLLALHDLVLK